jgi:hypothetical protein
MLNRLIIVGMIILPVAYELSLQEDLSVSSQNLGLTEAGRLALTSLSSPRPVLPALGPQQTSVRLAFPAFSTSRPLVQNTTTNTFRHGREKLHLFKNILF